MFKEAKKSKNETAKSTSIIICSKNDGRLLRTNLKSILKQSSLNELILVDDHSSPPLDEVIDQALDQRIKILRCKIDAPGKKQALSEGIKEATNEILLLTDADCCPISPSWLSLMQSKISSTKKIVLGYGPLTKSPSWVNRFSRYETWFTAQSYFSLALLGAPYMGVGRNLMYKKSLFSKTLFEDDSVASGDDDLLIQKIATKENTTIQINPDSFVYSQAPLSWKQFFNQKRRHHTTASRYKSLHKIYLLLNPLSHIGTYTFFFLLLFTHFAYVGVFLFLVRLLIMVMIANVNLRKLKELDLLIYLPLLDIMHVVFYIILGPFLLMPQKSKWN